MDTEEKDYNKEDIILHLETVYECLSKMSEKELMDAHLIKMKEKALLIEEDSIKHKFDGIRERVYEEKVNKNE